jgi:hypothetical protein
MPPGGFKLGPGEILLIIGGLLLMIGLFMDYITVTMSMTFMGSTTSASEGVTGWQLATEASPSYPILFLVLIMGILALLSPFILRNAPIIGGIFGIIGVLCATVGWFQARADVEAAMGMLGDFEGLGIEASVEVGVGIGLIISSIGGILALVGGILATKQR